MVADLADALGIDRFGVWGYSGGGPYAAACVAVLGDRVDERRDFSRDGPDGGVGDRADFAKTDRQFLELAPAHPERAGLLLRVRVLGRAAESEGGREVVCEELPGPDAATACAPRLAQGHDGDVHRRVGEGSAWCCRRLPRIAQPWHVDLGAITAPVTIFHGDVDPMVPLSHAQALANAIPERRS